MYGRAYEGLVVNYRYLRYGVSSMGVVIFMVFSMYPIVLSIIVMRCPWEGVYWMYGLCRHVMEYVVLLYVILYDGHLVSCVLWICFLHLLSCRFACR